MKDKFKYLTDFQASREVVEKSSYHGISFAIIDIGPWPCAYVELHDSIDRDDIDDCSIHGGISYEGGAYWDEDDDKLYIGWDYAHICDKTPYSSINAHEWTPAEVLEEVKQVIDEIYSQKWYQKQVEAFLRNKGCTDEDVARLLSSENIAFARNNNIVSEDMAWSLLY